MRGNSHVRFGSRGMGNYAGRKAGSTSCPYYIKSSCALALAELLRQLAPTNGRKGG